MQKPKPSPPSPQRLRGRERVALAPTPVTFRSRLDIGGLDLAKAMPRQHADPGSLGAGLRWGDV